RGAGRFAMRQSISWLFVLGGVAAAAVAARAADPAPPHLSRLRLMGGRWVGGPDGGALEGIWTSPARDPPGRPHKELEGAPMVSFEFLRIDRPPGGGTAYLASPRSAPPTPFELIELADERVVFENKQHDFPQRILYWRTRDGALHARIEGSKGGQALSEEWSW